MKKFAVWEELQTRNRKYNFYLSFNWKKPTSWERLLLDQVSREFLHNRISQRGLLTLKTLQTIYYDISFSCHCQCQMSKQCGWRRITKQKVFSSKILPYHIVKNFTKLSLYNKRDWIQVLKKSESKVVSKMVSRLQDQGSKNQRSFLKVQCKIPVQFHLKSCQKWHRGPQESHDYKLK